MEKSNAKSGEERGKKPDKKGKISGNLFASSFKKNIKKILSENYRHSVAILRKFSKSRVGKACGLSVVVSLVAVLFVDYFTTLRIVSVSETRDLDARDGKIVIRYSQPVTRIQFRAKRWELTTKSELSKDGLSETHILKYPTPYKSEFELVPSEQDEQYKLMGLFRIRANIALNTGIESVKIARLDPAERSLPEPLSLGNRISLVFNGEFNKRYREQKILQPEEIDFVKMEPKVRGYYQWSRNNELTFYFTENKPAYDTTYSFKIFPAKLIDHKLQKWVGKKTQLTLRTAKNDIRIKRYSIEDKAQYNDVLAIKFSGDMVNALDVDQKLSSVNPPATLAPKVGGSWKWINTYTLQFTPKKEWPIRETITVKVNSDINKEKDRPWRYKTPRSHSFYVEPDEQKIESFKFSEKNIELNSILKVNFKHPLVHRKQLRIKIMNSSDQTAAPIVIKPFVAGNFFWTKKNVLAFKPKTYWAELTEYKVTINPRYKLNPRYKWIEDGKVEFATEENVVHAKYYFTPENRVSYDLLKNKKRLYSLRTNIKPEQRLWIRFDRDLARYVNKKAKLDDLLSISPSVNADYTWLDDNLLEIKPKSNWQQDTYYNIRLKQGLLYAAQQHFKQGEGIFQFTTARNIVSIQGSNQYSGNRDQTDLIQRPADDFSVKFSKNMKTHLKIGQAYSLLSTKIKLPVKITPPLKGSVIWKNNRELVIKPKSYWKPETVYGISLGQHLLPQQEASYEFGDNVFFKTQKNYFQLRSFTPRNIIGRKTVVEAVFNKDIKPKYIKVGKPISTTLFAITPKLPGNWSWVSANTIRFKPEKLLDLNTRYRVTFDPNKVKDKQFSWYLGKNKKTDLYDLEEYNFRTKQFRVIRAAHVSKFDENDLLKERFVIRIALSDPVDFDEFRKHFSIWYQGKNDRDDVVKKAITYKAKALDKDNVKNILIESNWTRRVQSKDRKVYFGITKGLKAQRGNIGFESDYQDHFVQNALNLVKINKVVWQHKFGETTAVITVNAPIRKNDLSKYLSVRHTADLKEKNRDWEGSEKMKFRLKVNTQKTRNRKRAKVTVYRVKLKDGFKPGQKYAFVINKGLLALNGYISLKDSAFKSQSTDYKNRLSFASKGMFLSRKDMNYLPIRIVNEKRVKLVIERMYSNNVSYFLNNKSNYVTPSVAKKVFEKKYNVSELVKTEEVHNKQYVATLNMNAMFKNNPHGLYRVTLYSLYKNKPEDKKEYQRQTDSRWFLATDLGLNARSYKNGVLVWASSLKDASSLSNIDVRAVDAWNQVIGKGKTNKKGVAIIKVPANSEPKHIIAVSGSDMSLLNLREHSVELGEYDIEGVESQGQTLKAYLYSSRGAYRPGETVKLVGVIRDQSDNLPKKYPAEIVFYSPSGSIKKRQKFKIPENGIYTYDFATDGADESGKWNATIRWKKKNIGSYTFQVEEFIPNKINVSIEAPKLVRLKEQAIKFNIIGEHKFGGAAVGLEANAKIKLFESHFLPKGIKGYHFGNAEKKFEAIEKTFEGKTLEANGGVEYVYGMPDTFDVSTGIRAQIAATVIDDAGRGVSKYKSVNILLFDSYIGLKNLTVGGFSKDKPARFHMLNVDAEGKSIDSDKRKFDIKVYRMKELAYFRKNQRGYYRYVTEKVKTLFTTFGAKLENNDYFEFIPSSPGEYIVEAIDKNSQQKTQFKFRIWGSGLAHRLQPDKITMRAITKKVQSGSPIKIQVNAPFSGQLLLTVEREKVLYHKVMSVSRGIADITLPANDEFYPNVYISATLIRQVKQKNIHDAIIARGLMNVPVYNQNRKPKLEIEVADYIEPEKTVSAKIKVHGQHRGDVYFTLAAVDTGILDLTNFKLPSIANYFRTKIKLETLHHTMYHLVMPFTRETKERISPSGDEDEAEKKRLVNPDSMVRVKPVALWSGVVKLDKNGTATVNFDIPAFNGSLRFHAVVFGDKRYAMSSKDVLVYDKLILRPGVPRFFSVNDEVIIPVTVFNKTGKTDKVKISIRTNKHLLLHGSHEQTVEIAKDKKARVEFRLKVSDIAGIAKLDFIAETADLSRKKQVLAPVRYASSKRTIGELGKVKQGTPKTLIVPKVFIDKSIDYRFNISSSPLAAYANSLDYLVQYPHGCLEQTTSKLFPMLYFRDLATAAGISAMSDKRREKFIKAGIQKLERMQSNNGLFYYWSGSREINDWASIYASHFLVEAKNFGYKIGDKTWKKMIVHLKKGLGSDNVKSAPAYNIYKLYVLALSGENVIAHLNYIFDNQLDNLAPHDKARLAMVYHLLKEKSIAKSILKDIGGLSRYNELYRKTGGSFASNIRDLAIVLDAYVLIDPASVKVNIIIEKLISMSDGGRWGTTQENAFAFLALGKAYSKDDIANVNATVILGDGTRIPFKKHLKLGVEEYRKGNIRIALTGEGTLSYSWEAKGIRNKYTTTREDSGLVVRKRYLDKEGKEIDINNIKQGDLVVVEVSIRSSAGHIYNVAIVDLLPSGLEIENSRLSTSAKLDWTHSTLNTQYKDIRDDRMVLYADVSPQVVKHYYITRAVTAGVFSVPEIRAEAMYDPKIFSWANKGKMRIVAKKKINKKSLVLK